MVPWIDPKKSAAKDWTGEESDDADTDSSMRSVRERAYYTSRPFQYETVVRHAGTLEGFVIDGTSYQWGKFRYNGGVTETRMLKLSADGYLWRRSETPAAGFRFKAQVNRERPPTDTEPFGKYHVWIRSKSGRVSVDDSTPAFTPDDAKPTTDRITRRFDALPQTSQIRIAELELIRNQPLAEYALRVREEWEEYVTQFRFTPTAFTQR
jgi:hypothetical protein